MVHRISDDTGRVAQIPLEPSPESGYASVSLMEDLAIDSSGRIFVPAIWRLPSEGGGAGILQYDSSGHYERTIVLLPRSNVRHLALDSSDNIFVLGLDPDYFRGITNSCFLIHKYSPDGKGTASFSPCPVPSGQRSASGADWQRLNLEVDRGNMWLRGRLLYQLLPVSHQIRVFDAITGVAVATTALQPPKAEEPGLASRWDAAVIWRVLPVRGQYLALWSITTDGARSSMVSLHDSQGFVVKHVPRLALEGAVPISSREDGAVLLMSQEASGVGLTQSELQLR